MNGKGHPIPWYTYPCIDFIVGKNFADKKILEFGAGQSTLWWARHAKSVVSLESNEVWFEEVKKRIPPNVRIYYSSPALEGFRNNKISKEKFDVIIVDGFDRARAAAEAEKMIKPNGCIIVDNADGFWGREGTYPIMDLFRIRGFSRIDFYGHAPGVILPHCTSLFFKKKCFLLAGQENPRRIHES